MDLIRTIIVPTLLLIIIVAISIRHYKIAEGFNSGWSSDPPPNPFVFCPNGVIVLAINSSNQVHYECYKNGITNADAIFSSSNPIVNLEAPQGTTVSLYSDINGTGSIVASLPVKNEFNESSFRSQLKGFKFKSIKVTLPNSTATPAAVPDVSGTVVDISGVDVSGNKYPYPNIPLADLLSMFHISTAKPKTTTDTTDTIPAPIATASAATTAAPPISLDTLKSLIRKEVVKEMEEDEMCECEESPSIQQGCNVQKKKIDLSMNTQKDSIPCWGC